MLADVAIVLETEGAGKQLLAAETPTPLDFANFSRKISRSRFARRKECLFIDRIAAYCVETEMSLSDPAVQRTG
jgi:hypothetical protein